MTPRLTGQALLVLGAPRSGTSAIANAFRLLGFYLGDETDFPEPKEGNPQGIFERKEILAFNGKASEELYLRHDRPDMSSMTEHPCFPRLVDEASSILRGQFAGLDRWGWKEPQTTLLAPIYQAALGRDGVVPGYVLCVRRPAEVFQSQNKIVETAESNREAPLGVRAYRRWLAYTLKSLTASQGARRAMIPYHQLVEAPRAVLDVAFRAITEDAPGPDALEMASASIRSDLHRNRVGEDVPPNAPSCVHRLWELCCEIGKDPVGLCEGRYDGRVAEIEAEYQLLSTCFGEPEPPHCSVLFYPDGERTVFASPVLPTSRWNEVEIEIPVRASTKLLGMLYPMPANAFIRNARWGDVPTRVRATNDTVESPEGDATRFALGFSPPQITLRVPSEVGPYRLRMEVFVEMNIFTSMDALMRQTKKTRALESQIVAMNDHLAKLEAQTMKSRSQ